MNSSTDRLDSLIKELMAKALEDGVITNDEHKLITQIKIDIEKYKLALEKALEDGVITPEEKSLLISLEERILETAWDIAEQDSIVSEDESSLIKLLFKTLSSINYDDLEPSTKS